MAVSAYIFSSKRANPLQVLYIRTLGNIQGTISNEGPILKMYPQNFSGSFRTAEKLALENYILAYYTVNKDHDKIL